MSEIMLPLKIARDAFINGDHAVLARNTGAVYDPAGQAVKITYMGKPVEICCADAAMTGGVFELEQTLILHNLLTATGRPLTGKQASFRDMPKGGAYYYDSFKKRTVDVLARVFGSEPQRLYLAAEAVPSERAEGGDAALRIFALSRLPVTLVVWKGDEEMESAATVLFDSAAHDYLPVEDLAMISGLLVGRVVKAVRAAEAQ